MPVIFRYKGYRFFFFSNEGDPLEPAHIHIRNGARRAKFWIEPEVILADAYEMGSSELKEIESIVRDKQKFFKEAWNDYFGGSSRG